MEDITQLLNQTKSSDKEGLKEVFERLHCELRILAKSRIYAGPDQTMTATALVHELYIRMVGTDHLDLHSRQHFFACAGIVMRNILVDAARTRKSEKRGGDMIFVTLGDQNAVQSDAEILALNDVLTELEQVEPEWMELVHMRFFAGLTVEEIATLQKRSQRSVYREWECARAFLNARLTSV